MTFSREDDRSKITFRVSDSFKEHIEENVGEEYVTKSELIRDAIREKIGDSESDKIEVRPPDDPKLQSAFKALLEAASESGYLDHDGAKSILAVKHGIPKQMAQESLLKPLQQRGYIHLQSDWAGQTSKIKVRRYYNE